ncbi:MAG: hypothetical protein IPP68_03755 [Elusimicrobia bacterium]|nr:hypothetical protein [Elusimicrobiota bacterium]
MKGKSIPSGLKEKILAALEDRASTVILPVGNKEELIKTIFIQSPDLKGIIEENGLQRITVEQKKPVGNPSSPTAEDSTWIALNAFLSTKAQRYGLLAESDRFGALNLAGTPVQMRQFLTDSEIQKNISYPVTYLIVSNVEEALNALRTPDGNDGSEGPLDRSSAPPSASVAMGGTFSALLPGLFYSSNSSAATLLPSVPDVLTLSSAALAPVLLFLGVVAFRSIRPRVNVTLLSQKALRGFERLSKDVFADVASKALALLFESVTFPTRLKNTPLAQGIAGAADAPLSGRTFVAQFPLLSASLSGNAYRFWEARWNGGEAGQRGFKVLADWAEKFMIQNEIRGGGIADPFTGNPGASAKGPDRGNRGQSISPAAKFAGLVRSVSFAINPVAEARLNQVTSDLVGGKTPVKDSVAAAMEQMRGDGWKSNELSVFDAERLESARAGILAIKRMLVVNLSDPPSNPPSPAGREIWKKGGGVQAASLNVGLRPLSGGQAANEALFLRPVSMESQEVYILDAELVKTGVPDEIQSLLKQQGQGNDENRAMVVVVSEKDATDQVKSLLPADRWGLPSTQIMAMGYDGLTRASAIEYAPSGRRVSVEALKTEIARWSGGGSGRALRVTLWAAAGRSDVFSGELARLISVEQDLLLEGVAAAVFVEHLRQMFGPEEAARMIRDLSPDGTGRTLRLPGRSPLLQETVNAIQTDLLIQTNA